MTDLCIAVLAGFVAGLLVGWFSMATILGSIAVSGRISDSEEHRDHEVK